MADFGTTPGTGQPMAIQYSSGTNSRSLTRSQSQLPLVSLGMRLFRAVSKPSVTSNLTIAADTLQSKQFPASSI
eukprot:4902309-Pyramimonas_sp.AAC.1